MIASTYTEFDGRLVFECSFRTPGTDNRSAQLYTALKETGVLETDAEQRTAATLAMVICSTVAVTVTDEAASPHLRGVKAFWAYVSANILTGRRVVTTNPEALIEMWGLYDECVSDTVWKFWIAAYSQANVLYPATDRATVPTSALTEAERNDPELQKKDSNILEGSVSGRETLPSA